MPASAKCFCSFADVHEGPPKQQGRLVVHALDEAACRSTVAPKEWQIDLVGACGSFALHCGLDVIYSSKLLSLMPVFTMSYVVHVAHQLLR